MGAPTRPRRRKPMKHATEAVQEAAHGMLGELDRDRAAYRRDPESTR